MASHSRLYQSTSTMECEINELSYHVDASHKQACSDLEKASQFITEALQNEFQRNLAVRMLIHRLEDRAAENGRSLSEQVESNRQLKLQVDELQKQIQNKNKSLAQAKQSNAILRNEVRELQQQLQSHQDGHRTIQEVAEWLQDGDSQPNAVKEEGGVPQNRVVGIKEENNADDGYQKCQSDETDNPTEQTNSSSEDIKAELLQEADERVDMSPTASSEMSQAPPDPEADERVDMSPSASSEMSQASPDPVKPLRLAVQLVDCSVEQHQQATTSKDNKDGEQYNTGMEKVFQLSSSAVPKPAALSEAQLKKQLHSVCGKTVMNRRNQIAQNPLAISTSQHSDIPQSTPRHQIQMKGKPCYNCFICGTMFSTKRCLVKHRLVHKGEKHFHCQQCGKSFVSARNLKRHQQTHTGDKAHHCPQCGKSFQLASDLKRHLRVHTGERPYHCGQCGSSFSTAGCLRRHQRFHTGHKPHGCERCGKRFVIASDLRQHQRLHTREKP